MERRKIKPFNGTIWNRIPKQYFVKLRTFEIGVYDAVGHFHIGNLATLLIYDAGGVECDYWTEKGCLDDDNYRKCNSRRQSDTTKKHRCKLRGLRS